MIPQAENAAYFFIRSLPDGVRGMRVPDRTGDPLLEAHLIILALPVRQVTIQSSTTGGRLRERQLSSLRRLVEKEAAVACLLRKPRSLAA